MLIPKLSALFETSLSSALSAAGTTFTVVSGTDRDGNALSGLYGFILSEGSANEEFVIGTISGTTVTISYRGIDADAPNTEVSANKQQHRRGASVKITDYPFLGILRNMINGEEGLPNAIKYATGVAPVTADDLVDKAYADALVGGGTLSYDRIVIAGNAGETVAAGNLLYLDVADGEWKKCDADTAGLVENINLGIAQGAGTDGNSISGGVLIYGIDTNQTGLTTNTKYYASNTAGGISSTTGTKEVTVGISRSTTSLFFAPRFDQQITEDVQDALAGSSGTPSASNKFITEAHHSSATGLPVVRTYLNAGSPATWNKPAGLKYVIVEVQAGGGGGGSEADTSKGGSGGGGGGYSRKLIAVATLGTTETVTTGAGGAANGAGNSSSFGTHATATGGGAGGSGAAAAPGGAGGIGSSGDVNIKGQGGGGSNITADNRPSGSGGSSHLGGGGKGVYGADGEAGGVYGGGGSGAACDSTTDRTGGAGAAGVVIVTEYYS